MTRLRVLLDHKTAEVNLKEKNDLMTDSDKVLNKTARPDKFLDKPGAGLEEVDMTKARRRMNVVFQFSSPTQEFVCPKEEKEEKLFERHAQVSVNQHLTT